MVARQPELRDFAIERKVTQFFLYGEFVTEAQAIVEKAETDVQQPAGSVLL